MSVSVKKDLAKETQKQVRQLFLLLHYLTFCEVSQLQYPSTRFPDKIR